MRTKNSETKSARAKKTVAPKPQDTPEVKVLMAHLLRHLPDSMTTRADIFLALFYNLPPRSPAWALATKLATPLLLQQNIVALALEENYAL